MQLRLLKAQLVLAVLSLSAPLFAEDPSRPVCSVENQGHMWPEAANHDPKLLSRLARCGELFICERGNRHYHWQAPSVRFDQLGRSAVPGAKSKTSTPPGCEIPSANEASQPAPSATTVKVE